ncbi:MAG TPA: SAM-dependent methyltransferase, partial [Acidimicrobiales bacterium]|nr:SAM-dependent methyltransferase [Acidimicrobiales bacterium]
MSPGARRRLDTELVRRGLAPTRQEAQAAIAAGAVLVSGAPATKAARLVAPDEPVVLAGLRAPFVSRGGLKLDAALTRFAVPVAERRALDAGASTGGFTDCLLQRGASRVYAVDVGHGQLDPSLRADGRVTV